MSTVIVTDNMPLLTRGMAMLLRDDILVGVPADGAHREGDGSGPSNADLAYIHETGSPSRNIPERPFLVPGMTDIRDEIAKRMRTAAIAALRGRVEEVERQQNAIGLLCVSSVRRRLVQGPHAPLAPATLAARRRRGRTGTRPLVDTGQLLAAITYAIRRKSGRK